MDIFFLIEALDRGEQMANLQAILLFNVYVLYSKRLNYSVTLCRVPFNKGASKMGIFKE